MATLVDTNILLRTMQPSHPMHAVAVQAVKVLMDREEPLVLAIQNVAECWNGATRPVENNGLGFTIEEAQAELANLEDFFEIVSETLASYTLWKSLLVAQRIRGVQVHDARLASVMIANGIRRIVTFNASDFARFSDIEAVHPSDVC